jgi:uncharacterized NAD(P)/FAD-binding protein YdhS
MRVVVVGAGYSGTVAAVELARRGLEPVLIEKSGRFAAGAAYSTTEPGHLLNVRARNMSALAGDPDHFTRWAGGEGYGADDYVPRRDFGRYLAELLNGAAVRRVSGEAVAVERGAVRLASGEQVAFDQAVLAGGNYAGRLPAVLGGLEAVLVDDPWSAEGATGVKAAAAHGGDVLLLGTGLTMVDMAVTLAAAGHQGRMIATSRRGLVPRAHVQPAPKPLDFEPPERLGELLRSVRALVPWRAAVDGLRPHSVALWRGLSGAERRRFLRHLRPWWDVHRHRIAPAVAARIEELRGSGRLEVVAGRIQGAEEDSVTIARRGGGELKASVAAVINCTGPEGDIGRVRDPLIRQLLESGAARPDPLRLGLDVDEESRVISREGASSPDLYAIGPLSKGAFWEIVAVPDIRSQVRGVAEAIAAGR